jgi:uncharacterized protein (TIGR03067 family)
MFASTLVCIAFTLGVPLPADKMTEEQKKEMKKFVGLWEFKEVIREGKSRERHWLEDLTVEYAENGCYMIKHQDRVVGLGRITIDPTTNPKQLNLVYSERGEYDGKLRGVHEVEGIYKIEKDSITLCFNTEGNNGARPTTFSSTEKEQRMLETLIPYQWKAKKTDKKSSGK